MRQQKLKRHTIFSVLAAVRETTQEKANTLGCMEEINLLVAPFSLWICSFFLQMGRNLGQKITGSVAKFERLDHGIEARIRRE